MATVQDGVVGAMEERVADLSRELLARDELIVHLQAEKRELQRWAERLHHQLHSTENVTFAEANNNEVANLEREVTAAHDKLKTLSAQVLTQKDEISRLYRQVYEKEGENQELVSQLQTLRNALAELQCQAAPEPPSVEPQKRSPNEWVEDTARYPKPHFPIDSKEVLYLVGQWTQNPSKIKSLMTWLVHMSSLDDTESDGPFDGRGNAPSPTLPLAIELPRLPNEVRDGFLTLVVPLLRHQMTRAVHVHTRPYDANHTDLRIRVSPKGST
ncbi:hypothetical protein H310_06904 [Aphanomyces invadans]|uniref:Uncharacterized protein n=1 Tax=Aphanomyces invadans TaxID=157072 RepID=A0A024U4L8_9STRA|nr:hypothetical protein H310_06904 [Aphanomyces invadans]ETW01346.1 hypothetical protein H310_06904 [Aphanomyces invadans]|eukprot:XP_008870344.1 hypothetical protein H310_06904 [Aphanomyces invadans]